MNWILQCCAWFCFGTHWSHNLLPKSIWINKWEKWWHGSTDFDLVSLIGCCLVETTNWGNYKDFCRATSSVWYLLTSFKGAGGEENCAFINLAIRFNLVKTLEIHKHHSISLSVLKRRQDYQSWDISSAWMSEWKIAKTGRENGREEINPLCEQQGEDARARRQVLKATVVESRPPQGYGLKVQRFKTGK